MAARGTDPTLPPADGKNFLEEIPNELLARIFDYRLQYEKDGQDSTICAKGLKPLIKLHGKKQNVGFSTSTPSTLAFQSPKAAVCLLQQMQTRILTGSDVVRATVLNLDFAELRKFITVLETKGLLHTFDIHNLQRRLEVEHVITKDLRERPTSFNMWCKEIKALRAQGFDLDIRHSVKEADPTPLDTFLRYNSGVDSPPGSVLQIEIIIGTLREHLHPPATTNPWLGGLPAPPPLQPAPLPIFTNLANAFGPGPGHAHPLYIQQPLAGQNNMPAPIPPPWNPPPPPVITYQQLPNLDGEEDEDSEDEGSAREEDVEIGDDEDGYDSYGDPIVDDDSEEEEYQQRVAGMGY